MSTNPVPAPSATEIDQNRLARLCRHIRIIALGLLAAIPVVLVWYWSDPHAFPWGGHQTVSVFAPEGPLSMGKRIGGLAISLLPGAALVLGILGIHRLAGLFAIGRFISADAIRALRLAAAGFIAFAAMSVVHRTLLVLLLTHDRAPGERVLAIGVEGDDVLLLLFGLMLLALARVFLVERARAEDQALIV